MIELDLALAIEVADAADAFTLPRFEQRDFTVDWKTNATEVTAIDRNAEALIVERLRAARPAHAVFGEAHGLAGADDAEWRWLVDPIDGTSGFVRGIPVRATLIALTHRGTPVLGVVSAPALGFRWWGGRDGDTDLGAHMSARGRTRRLEVSSVQSISEAQVSVTPNDGWADVGGVAALMSMALEARRGRGMGDFWQHMLVAEGAIDVAVDAIGVAPYALAALQPIVEAAGGSFTDRHGEATHLHDSAVSSNGHLHAEVISRLGAIS